MARPGARSSTHLVLAWLAAQAAQGCKTPDADPSTPCDSGFIDDSGQCVPAACGRGRWGALAVDDSTLYVDINADDGGDGSQNRPFTSVQAGLDAAGSAGVLVAVAAGTYPETLVLNAAHAGARLAGRCADLVVIDASVGDDQTPGLWVSTGSAAVEVAGVTVRGSPWTGVVVNSGHLLLRESVVTKNAYVGVWVAPTGLAPPSAELVSCAVLENTMLGIAALTAGRA